MRLVNNHRVYKNTKWNIDWVVYLWILFFFSLSGAVFYFHYHHQKKGNFQHSPSRVSHATVHLQNTKSYLRCSQSACNVHISPTMASFRDLRHLRKVSEESKLQMSNGRWCMCVNARNLIFAWFSIYNRNWIINSNSLKSIVWTWSMHRQSFCAHNGCFSQWLMRNFTSLHCVSHCCTYRHLHNRMLYVISTSSYLNELILVSL